MEFEGGRRPPDRNSNQQRGASSSSSGGGGFDSSKLGKGLPNLKPDARRGTCQPYVGEACSEYVGQEYVFISEGLRQEDIEKQLSAAFAVISVSPKLSPACSPYAIPVICLSTLPLCDRQTERPRRLCREECEVLESRICRTELLFARQYASLEKQLVLPECPDSPRVGSPESANCVRVGVPEVSQLIRPHSCYRGGGKDYRGTSSTTESGLTCQPWDAHPTIKSQTSDHLELIGGHNFCRMPSRLDLGIGGGGGGFDDDDGPWCYATVNGQTFRESCGVPRCGGIEHLYLYVAAGAAVVAVLLLGLCIGICCMRRGGSSEKVRDWNVQGRFLSILSATRFFTVLSQ